VDGTRKAGSDGGETRPKSGLDGDTREGEGESASEGALPDAVCNGVTIDWIGLTLANALDLWSASQDAEGVRRNVLAILEAIAGKGE
jgi:hypothetical protein